MLNAVAQDVRNRLQSQAAVLKQYNQEFLATQMTIWVSFSSFCFLLLNSSVGVRQRTHWV